MPYVVVVTFTIKPELFDVFIPLILSNARTSLSVEVGCHQFDVAIDADRPNEVFLYEVYEDRSAFDEHLESRHFKAFDVEAVDMIASKDVRNYAQVVQ